MENIKITLFEALKGIDDVTIFAEAISQIVSLVNTQEKYFDSELDAFDLIDELNYEVKEYLTSEIKADFDINNLEQIIFGVRAELSCDDEW